MVSLLRARAIVAGGVGALLIAAGALGLSFGASAAKAWPWDSHVILNGQVVCPGLFGDSPSWLYFSGNKGDYGFAYLGSGTRSRYYKFDMHHVPAIGSEWLSVSAGCSATGTWYDGFGVNRPKVGNYQTRNIYLVP